MVDREPALTVHEAADALGVHYMTAYRWIRTGRLPAVQDGREWRIRAEDLEAAANPPTAPANSTSPAPDGSTNRRRRVDHAARLADRLTAGDETGTWKLIEAAQAGGMSLDELQLVVLTDAMRRVGAEWEAGRLTIAEEHQASAIAQRILGRLAPQAARAGRPRGTIVIGAPAGDAHGLPVALLVNPLRARGHLVADLGADTPADAFADAAQHAGRLHSVGIAATTADGDAISEAVAALRATVGDVFVVIGGGAASAELAATTGADAFAASGPDAVQLLTERTPA